MIRSWVGVVNRTIQRGKYLLRRFYEAWKASYPKALKTLILAPHWLDETQLEMGLFSNLGWPLLMCSETKAYLWSDIHYSVVWNVQEQRLSHMYSFRGAYWKSYMSECCWNLGKTSSSLVGGVNMMTKFCLIWYGLEYNRHLLTKIKALSNTVFF